MKVLSGRPRDLEDARGILLRQAGKIDLAAVRRRLREFERALARSDLAEKLDKMKAATRGR